MMMPMLSRTPKFHGRLLTHGAITRHWSISYRWEHFSSKSGKAMKDERRGRHTGSLKPDLAKKVLHALGFSPGS